MKITSEAIQLIKAAEGFRGNAYPDATGIWTIGYGHTSAAGSPIVHQGMVITREEGESILAKDIDIFVRGLRPLLKRDLTDRQFSALISFAYNVGLGNVARSSVLTAINAGDFEAVPRRLALWVKAGGKTLPGLVRRRAAEAAMFADGRDMPANPDVPITPPIYRSRTLWSAFAVVIASLAQAFAKSESALSWLAVGALVIAATIIIFERLKKFRLEGL
jgi:lysozyme